VYLTAATAQPGTFLVLGLAFQAAVDHNFPVAFQTFLSAAEVPGRVAAAILSFYNAFWHISSSYSRRKLFTADKS